jgi:hypothetical protein
VIDFRPDPAGHVPIVSFDQDVVTAGKLDMPVGDLFLGADLKSLPLLRQDRLLRTSDPPCVDNRFACQFVIGAPFGENFGRGTGGTKKASASTRASKVSGHGAPLRLITGSAETAEAQRFNVTMLPINQRWRMPVFP